MSRFNLYFSMMMLFNIAFYAQAQTAVSYTTFNQGDKQKVMKHWTISEDAFHKYNKFMSVEGKYRYAHLTPLEVLTIIADDEEERYYYAKKMAVNEKQAVQAQLATAQAYAKAARDLKLYPENKSIKLKPVAKLASKDALLILISPQCNEYCRSHLLEVISKISNKKSISVKLVLKDPGSQSVQKAKDHLATYFDKEKIKYQVQNFDSIEHGDIADKFNQVIVYRNNTIVGILN